MIFNTGQFNSTQFNGDSNQILTDTAAPAQATTSPLTTLETATINDLALVAQATATGTTTTETYDATDTASPTPIIATGVTSTETAILTDTAETGFATATGTETLESVTGTVGALQGQATATGVTTDDDSVTNDTATASTATATGTTTTETVEMTDPSSITTATATGVTTKEALLDIAEPATATATGLTSSEPGKPAEGDLLILVDGEEIEAYQDLVVETRLNEVDTFELKAFITDESQRGLLSEGRDVLIFEDLTLLFKGRFEDVTYDSSFEATCEGEGMATKLLDRKTDRDTYDNTAADNIVKDLLPSETVGEGVIEPAPTTSLSFDHDNKARAIAGAANAVGYDWRMRTVNNNEDDVLDFKERIGSTEPVEDYVIGENAFLTEDETDDGFQANDITLLGRGDGINQLEARVYAAAADYTQLTDEITENQWTGTLIDVDDTTVLGAVGDEVIAKIGVELMRLEITSSTQAEILERGVQNWENEETKIITHRENISVWLYENITQSLGPYTPETSDTAEAGSSVAENGVKQLRDTDKTIIKTTTLEQVADRELRNRYEDIKSVRIKPTDPRIADTVSLGDQVTIDDDLGSKLSGEFRIVGMDISRRTAGEGTVLHCASRPRRLVERLSEIERDKDTLNAHMQGATNIDTQSFTDNCDTDNPLRTKLYITEDTVSVNKIEVVFAREDFRGYVQNSEHSHNFSVTIPDHSHDVSISVGDHSHDLPTTPFGVELAITSSDGPFLEDNPVTDSPDWETPNTLTIDGVGDSIESAGIASGSAGNQHTHIWPQSGQLPANLDIDSSSLTHTHYLNLANSELRGNLNLAFEKVQTTDGGGGFFESTTTENGGGTTESSTTDGGGDPVYGIFEQNETSNIDVDVVVDGTTVQTINNVSPGQEITDEIRIEEELSDPLTGSWHTVELVPSSQTRLTANVFQKVFIESTL